MEEIRKKSRFLSFFLTGNNEIEGFKEK